MTPARRPLAMIRAGAECSGALLSLVVAEVVVGAAVVWALADRFTGPNAPLISTLWNGSEVPLALAMLWGLLKVGIAIPWAALGRVKLLSVLRFRRRDLVVLPVSLLLGWTLCNAVGALVPRLAPAVAQMPPAYSGWLLAGGAASLLGVIAWSAGEEVFFRGYLQRRLLCVIGEVPALALSAIAFAILHFDIWRAPVLVGAGLLFGVLALRFNSILPSCAAHAGWNVATQWPLQRVSSMTMDAAGVVLFVGPVVLLAWAILRGEMKRRALEGSVSRYARLRAHDDAEPDADREV